MMRVARFGWVASLAALFACLAGLLSPALGGDGLGAGVIQLRLDSFERLTQAATGATTGDWFVKFYSPGCGHCKKIAPVWTKLAEELSGLINVAEVDVTRNRELGQRFGVRGVPQLVYFHKGKMFRYSGKRDLESLQKFAENVRYEGRGPSGETGEPVPAEPTLMDNDFVSSLRNNKSILYGGIIVMILVTVGISAAVAHSEGEEEETDKDK